MLLCREGNHRFILCCIVRLSQGKTRLEARPTRTDSCVARTGGWRTFHRIALAGGGCGDIDGRREAVVFSLLRGGGEGRQPTSAAALGGGGSLGNALHSLR